MHSDSLMTKLGSAVAPGMKRTPFVPNSLPWCVAMVEAGGLFLKKFQLGILYEFWGIREDIQWTGLFYSIKQLLCQFKPADAHVGIAVGREEKGPQLSVDRAQRHTAGTWSNSGPNPKLFSKSAHSGIDAMINIGLYYKVKAGHGKEFEDTFTGVVSLLRNSNFGFVGGKLYREVGDSSEYMLYTEWEGLDSFRKFIASKEYAKTVEWGKTVIDGQPRHRVFRG